MDFALRKNRAVGAAIKAMQESGLNLDYKIAEKEIYKLYDKFGIENHSVFEKFLEKRKLSKDYILLAKAVNAYIMAKYSETRTYPEVKSIFLKFIKKGIKLGIVSDAPRFQAYTRLVELGLEDFFDIILTFDDICALKDTTKPFEKALSLLKVPAKKVLFVGDRPDRDVLNARKVGMKTAFAAYGYYGGIVPRKVSKKELNAVNREYKPDYILNKFNDILKVIN